MSATRVVEPTAAPAAAALVPAFDDDADDRLFLQLHNLKSFAAIVDHGSGTAAAQALLKSSSAMTRGITELEQALGVALLERRGGKLGASEHGAVLLARVRRIEAEIGVARAELSRLPAASAAAVQHLLYSGRKLRLLIGLADAGTVSGAAARLEITQPGASMALGRIEEAIGTPLFHRNLQGIFETDTAARLIPRAKRIRAELRHAVSELSSVAGNPGGRIVIGALPMARTDILPRAIALSLRTRPGLRVQIVEAQREALIAQLRSGEIDALLSVPGPGFDPKGLVIEPLFADELAVVAGRSHPLASAARVMLHDIAGAEWVLPWSDSTSRALFDAQFARQGITPPRPAVQTGDLLLMRRLLADGAMLAATSLRLVQYELDTGLFVRIDAVMDRIERNVVLLRREGAQLSPAAHSLLDEVRRITA